MTVFVSFAARDKERAEPVIAALRRDNQELWFDEQMSGGESWWHELFHRIRTCDVFVVTLSDEALGSKQWGAQADYARALGKPIIAVHVGDMEGHLRFNPVGALRVIDYRDPGVAASIELADAVRAAHAKRVPLPDALPEYPPPPFAYLGRLADAVSAPTLNPAEQSRVLAELRNALVDDGVERSVLREVGTLLGKLRDRPDITYQTRMEVESLLGSLDDEARAQDSTHLSRPLYPRQAPLYPTAPAPAPPSAPPPMTWPAEAPKRSWWRRLT